MGQAAEQSEFYLYQGRKKVFNSDMGQKKQGRHETVTADTDDVCFDRLLEQVASKRDKQAFIVIFEHFAPRVKSFLMKGGLTPETADEIAQETLLAVWHKGEQFDKSQARASTWIFTIARNKKIDFFRKNSKAPLKPEDTLFSPSEPDLPDVQHTHAQQNERIMEALKDIPEEQAELLYKSYFEDKTHKDIAEETGIPLGTVKSRVRLALERMRYLLDGAEL